MSRPWFALLATVALCLARPTAALQRTETISLGAAPVAAWFDPAAAKLFVATDAGERGGGLAVLERDGRLTTIPLPAAPVALVGASAARRLLVAHANGSASLVGLDTLKVAAVPLAPATVVGVVADERAAFVLARTGRGTVLHAVDFKSRAVTSALLEDALPVDLAVASGRVLVLTAASDRPGDAPASVVHMRDARTLAPLAAPAIFGRLPRAIAANAAGDEVYVLDHAEAGRGGAEAWRPMLRVLDAALQPRRAIAVAEARTAPWQGTLQSGAAPGSLLLDDEGSARVVAANPATGALGTTMLESPAATVAALPGSGLVVAAMPRSGAAAVLSASGERLDTISIGHAANDAQSGAYAVVGGTEGVAFIVNGPEGTVVRMQREGPAAIANLTDLWADASEPGWGVFIEQQGLAAFAALFEYAPGGDTAWLVMSNGARQPDGSFSGVLFRTHGPLPVRPADAIPVGIMRIVPAVDGGATLTAVVDGNSVTRRIQRFSAGEPPRTCRWTASLAATPAARANFTALWSNPADPGWGLAIAHRGDSLFAVLFTYDDQGRPAWMVMSRGRQFAPGAFSGELYRIARTQVRAVGSMTLRFAASDEGVATWRAEGTEFRAPILKQRFAPLVSRCG